MPFALDLHGIKRIIAKRRTESKQPKKRMVPTAVGHLTSAAHPDTAESINVCTVEM
jgi:hypothetical protein